MKFLSTRGEKLDSSAEVILTGIAGDGGLYVPACFPELTDDDIDLMTEKNYPERAAFILSKFLTDYSEEELLEYAEKAYARFDGHPAPLVKVDEGTYIMELWHGPTFAFKDVALTMLPYLITGARKKSGSDKTTLILVATSGDTGKAALEGFKDVEGTEVIVLYPEGGVSDMQKLQMQTTEGDNVHVIGIKGNFDDAQTAVKNIFGDREMVNKLSNMGYALSSANSINFGRLAPQIVYYVSAYIDLLMNGEFEKGEKMNFVVPSGNFGNVLAGYYAMRMGLPINQLIVASNKNNILTDFFETGEYNANREFHKTMSPSMDILISSNLERLLFEMMNRDPEKVRDLMKQLKENGRYEIDSDLLYDCFGEFMGYFSTEEETASVMENFLSEYNYLLDPHTAVGVSAYFKYLTETVDETPTVIVSTANPYKFPQDVLACVGRQDEANAQKAIRKLELFSGSSVPDGIKELFKKPILHDIVAEKDEIKDAILKILEKE